MRNTLCTLAASLVISGCLEGKAVKDEMVKSSVDDFVASVQDDMKSLVIPCVDEARFNLLVDKETGDMSLQTGSYDLGRSKCKNVHPFASAKVRHIVGRYLRDITANSCQKVEVIFRQESSRSVYAQSSVLEADSSCG